MKKFYSIGASSALLGALAVAASAMAQTKDPEITSTERCYGVTQAGKNDCASGAHSCVGQSTKNADKSSFIAVPAGLCARLEGGSTAPGK
jgi:uncharacterized membrane protein